MMECQQCPIRDIPDSTMYESQMPTRCSSSTYIRTMLHKYVTYMMGTRMWYTCSRMYVCSYILYDTYVRFLVALHGLGVS